MNHKKLKKLRRQERSAAKRQRLRSPSDHQPVANHAMPLDQVRTSVKALINMHLWEIWETDRNFDDVTDDEKLGYIVNSKERARYLCLADPNIYKTPAGNMLWLDPEDQCEDDPGHYMSPAEAELWQIDGEEVDRRIANGLPPILE